MSIHVMTQVWQHAEVGGSELLVLLAMSDFAHDDGSSVYPSIKTLAEKARISSSQTRRIVHELIEIGYVDLVNEGGWDGNKNRSNEYRINVELLQKKRAENTTSPPLQDDSTLLADNDSTPLAPTRDDPLYNHHKKERLSFPDGKVPPDESEKEPEITPEEKPKPKAKRKKKGEEEGENEQKELTGSQKYFNAVLCCLGWDHKILDASTLGQVKQLIGILNKNGYTIDDLRAFFRQWKEDWRWKQKGDYPTIRQLKQEIGKVKKQDTSVMEEDRYEIDKQAYINMYSSNPAFLEQKLAELDTKYQRV